jgi:hypothetical protein
MGSKEKLAELISGLSEWQAAPLLMVVQAYLQGLRDAETKGRVDISSEMIKSPSENGPTATGGYARQAAPMPAIAPAQGTRG